MAKPDFYDLDKVMRELVLPFYATERAVPLLLAAGRRRENDAEHSWSLALVACMLAPHVDPKLDVGKVCQFAVVHDLTEVHAGDTSAFAPHEEHQTKEEREHQALQKIAKDFAHLPWLIKTLEAYERQDSDEAKYVRSIDKVLPLLFDYLTEGLYYHENQHTKEQFKAYMERPREKAKAHPGAFAYHEEVMAVLLSKPELFHTPAKTSRRKK
jgi:5'-deoxynucleotidase YfbR-like HD superfamily hydrolase